MDSDVNQQEIKDYFLLKKPKISATETNILLVMCFLIAFPIIKLSFSNTLLSTVAWLCIIIATYLLYWLPLSFKHKKYLNRISDNRLTQYFLKQCKTVVLNRAIEYLNIDKSRIDNQKLIIIPYPVFNNTKNISADNLHRKEDAGKNSKNKISFYNYSFWNIQILIFNENYISFYFCSYDLLNNEIINERSNEYFYEDMASVSTETKHVEFVSKWDEDIISEIGVIDVVNYSGDKLKLITGIPSLKQAPQTVVDAEKVAKTIRFVLRRARQNYIDMQLAYMKEKRKRGKHYDASVVMN